MTRTTNARVAGYTFLLYIIIGITQMIVGRSIPDVSGTTESLANIASHVSLYRFNMILGFTTGFIALTLAVALYGVTREEDNELAVLAMMCRVGEGISIFVPMLASLGLVWLATHTSPPDGSLALAEFLMKVKGFNVWIAATMFAVGSTIYCWLMLRGRMIPATLAWLGLIASVLLVIGLPLRMTGVIGSTASMVLWIPMAAFEIPLGLWFIVKGVR
jgi:hypothetical protein